MPLQELYRLTAEAWRTAPVERASGTARTIAAIQAVQR